MDRQELIEKWVELQKAHDKGKAIQVWDANAKRWWGQMAAGGGGMDYLDIVDLERHKYRIKPEPELVPFTWEDRDLLRDKWLVHKKTGIEMRILSLWEADNLLVANIGMFGIFSASDLLESCTFFDGSPCGKEEVK